LPEYLCTMLVLAIHIICKKWTNLFIRREWHVGRSFIQNTYVLKGLVL
jgi:hypothetical protein